MVADRCGVNVMTVTRALRPGSSVAPKTRAMILDVVKELGYQPRPNMGRPRKVASSIRQKVEVIMGTNIKSEFYLALLSSIEQELAARGLDCVVRTASSELEYFLVLCERLRNDRTVPTMVLGYLPTRQLEVLLEARPSAILVDHTGDSALMMPYRSIGFDNVEAGRLITRHLLDTGRKRILLVNGISGHYFSREIDRGYREALAAKGAQFDPALVVETDFTMEQADKRVCEAMDRGLDFDAVFTNDEMAVAVIGTLLKRGKRIPEDVAVAGCDGLPIGGFTVPTLTTVRLDYVRLGQLSVKYAFDEEAAQTPVRLRLIPELVIRKSTATPGPENPVSLNDSPTMPGGTL